LEALFLFQVSFSVLRKITGFTAKWDLCCLQFPAVMKPW